MVLDRFISSYYPMQSEEIRQLRDQFWKSKQHQEVKPVSLIAPPQDKTVIFNVAGMQQLVPYLSGKPHPQGKRLHNIQPCVRTVDIEEIGDERHLSLFEMMGFRSLGDYFKKEAIERTIEFLTQHLHLPKEKLWYGIFGGFEYDGTTHIPFDQTAQDTLLAQGINPTHIKGIPMYQGEKCDNFRWPAGAIGPCGPSAEPHYDRGEEYGPADRAIGENDRYLEIGNNVFMEYYKAEDGSLSKLSQQNIDTGMWFSRLVMVVQNTDTIYETDLFIPIIQAIQNYSKTPYPAFDTREHLLTPAQQTITTSYRIITDHIRAVTFLIAEGVIPSNESRGYVIRRLIRRAYFHFTLLSTNLDHTAQRIHETVAAVIDKYSPHYPVFANKTEQVAHTIMTEIIQFQKTLTNGEKKLHDIIARQNTKKPRHSGGDEVEHPESHAAKEISGTDAFLLYDTFGFPLDLTIDIAAKHDYQVDIAGYEACLTQAKKRSRASANKKFARDIDRAKYLDGIPPTQFVGYGQRTLSNPTILKQFQVGEQHIMIFDKTPFYAESGGQTGDTGTIQIDTTTTKHITNVQKYDGVYLHFIEK